MQVTQRKEVIKYMRALRILSRSIRDSFKSVFRNFSLSVASILCTTITLILVALALFLSYNVRQITTNLEHELTIVVYLKQDTTEEQKVLIQNDLKTMENVDTYKLKSKDEWKAEMKKESDTFKSVLDYLDTNPLLDSITVTVDEVRNLSKTAERLREYEFVSSAEYGEGMVENIIGVFDAISLGTIGMVVALVLVTAFLIGNTIKLTIFSRKTEIEIMRLVGASNTAIKLPFVFEGFILGVIGSIIPIALSIYGYVLLFDKTGVYLFTKIITLSKPFPFVLYVSLLLLLVGSLVGSIYGFAYGIIYKVGFDTGGSDILIRIVNKYLHMPEGKSSVVVQGIIILIGGIVFGINQMIYAIIILVLYTGIMDKIIIGISDSKMFFVYTRYSKKVTDFILNDLHTGVTILETEGGYTKEKRDTLMCVVPNKDYYIFKETILEIDPDAFFIIHDCYEVQGGVKDKNLPFI